MKNKNKPNFEEKFLDLKFAAEKVVEAFDYGQSIVEMENALDDLRECLHETD